MRIVVVSIALVLGGWLAFDGIRALTKGDYVTARGGKLGPWSRIVSSFGLRPRSTGMKLVHVILGIAWLASAACARNCDYADCIAAREVMRPAMRWVLGSGRGVSGYRIVITGWDKHGGRCEHAPSD
jgi:hypothetical protein